MWDILFAYVIYGNAFISSASAAGSLSLSLFGDLVLREAARGAPSGGLAHHGARISARLPSSVVRPSASEGGNSSDSLRATGLSVCQ